MAENGHENGTNGATAEKRKAENGENGHNGVAKREKLEGGTLLFSGATDWKLVGRKGGELVKSTNTQWSPVRIAALEDISIVAVNKGSSSAFCLAIADDGHVYSWGRNEAGQLGLGDTDDHFVPKLVKEITGYEVVEVATGKAHTLFLTSCGKVLAAGSNEQGQCGQGRKTGNLETPKLVVHDGEDIVSVACGAEFSVLLDKEGKVWTFGLPENGCLGHNDDGKFMQKANKVEFRCEYSPLQVKVWVEKDTKAKEVTPQPVPKIVKISCGTNHTVALTEEKKAYSWGFGGYGRLGHSETADELVPRLIKYLDGKNRGLRDIVCGASFNLGLSEIPGMVNMWGIYTPQKEANMYPKPIQDLSGWNVRSIACNTKGWMAAADDAVIACMPSPCSGELGTGEKKKSSAQPCIVDTLEGAYVLRLGAGPAHSLYVVRNQTDADKAKLNKFSLLDQSDME
eukprot:TRINITY_DN52596_c0_g1_i1.p1 TRINITY_DN52596_c0_g1~~TRINITY_DN52596_c0_g1_i1.p1  ORF type:complete len:455 (-),score=159.08 TRINITY_DN52596_c0_g1_i1:160-1524(-)